jgi:hypothetical protein
MFLKGRIKEFSGMIGAICLHKEKLFFPEANRVWHIDKKNKHNLYCECECGHIEHIRFLEGQFWSKECKDLSRDKIKYVFRQIDNPMKTGRTDKYPYPTSQIINDNIIGIEWKDDECYFVVKRRGGKKVIRNRTDCYRTAYDDSGIFAKNIFGKIVHLNYKLNIVWQKKFEKKNNARSLELPQIYRNIVIFNNGVDPSSRQDCDILAYNKMDGNEVWKQTFEEEVANCQLFGDHLYMTHRGNMIVLEAETGKTVINEPSGFESETASEILVPLEDNLVMISKEACAIRVFSKDGKTMIQHLDIPGVYETHNGGPLMIYNKKIYLRTYPGDMCLKGVKEGLLILERAPEGESGGIEIEKWPVSVDVIQKKEDSKNHVYQIEMHGNTLQDLLIYSEIVLEEVPSIYGAQIWSDERRDPKFKGKIIFCPKGIRWDAASRKKMEEKARFVEKWCKQYDIYAGDAKNPIHIEVEF